MNIFSFYKGGKALYCLFFTGILLSFSSAHSKYYLPNDSLIFQQHQIQGTVTDGSSPLPGVTISIKSRINSTVISDYNGQYSLSASPYDTLVVSFIGFKTALVPIKGRTKVDISLEFDTTTLQEVRVNAGYYSVKESERTGSIARITSKDIETQPVTNVLAAMQGRMAGVSIIQNSGVPGGGFDIKIRGQNSLRSDANAPLYIIDGVPYASDPIGYNQTSTTFPTVTSPLNSINPDTVESIEILKDADATAIYGSRGANGVVLITTKKGKGGKTALTVKSTTGVGTVTRLMKLMNTQEYLAMRRQAFKNDGLSLYPSYAYDINGTWDQNRYTDWQDEFLGGTAQINNIQAVLSGGSDTTQFMLSSSYHTESTVFPGDFIYKKGGLQFNLNHRSQDNKFKFTFSSGYTIQDNDQPAFDLTASSRYLAPNAPAVYNEKGELNWENNTWQNPLRLLYAHSGSKSNDLVSNAVLSYEIIPNLILKGNFGFTDLRHKETRTSPSTTYNPAYNLTSAYSSVYFNNTDRQSWIIEPQINWEKELSIGKIGMLAGGTFQNQTTDRLYQFGTGFTSNNLIYNLASAAVTRVLYSDNTQYKYQAFFGRINYNWQDRYILNLTGRRDGSSRFGPGNQFANYGAVGAAWIFSKENFIKENALLSFGKVRVSYGTTGNDQIGDYQFLNTYTSSGLQYDSNVGLQPSRLYNPDFGWEVNKKLEAALEIGFLKDKLFLTAAWYQNRSSNQLVGVPLAGTTGFQSLQANLNATVQNTGWEFTLRTINFNTLKFNWTTSLNLTLSKNKLLSFPGLEASSYNQKYRIGEPLNIELGYQYTGIDPQTGIYLFSDKNKDGTISFPEDKQTIMDLNPQYFGGLQNQLSYKGWKLDFLFQFVKQKNRTYYTDFAGQMANQPARLVGSWTQPGDNALGQIYTTGYNGAALTADYLFSQSTGSITDASFIRLKNIALSYDLPLNLKTTKCQLLLQGQNLLTFTKYQDGDPEFINAGYLPPLKIITAGIQLTF
ncbi:TonB-linked SusC/RagA family outer membrane protein [Flavobacterium sp. 90]|uniref:SusC/RagA family TonB-linked outer membrane protein n=1 Tax=unclassified Flavobacterium TaxID=196869 RepID=UPI000EABB213|nr:MULTISPECIES: SusC/RagA family TonB-linked outer membrane protein [unclassified Flavobacterium]RKR05150.1 TonB-linked SusC/RagA family outer membrane protein [Flavobacterium sp. 81]TCK56465.1 TonB-linked SusC/RagA family outer membrane protein [Flavobacterium sp. 90]